MQTTPSSEAPLQRELGAPLNAAELSALYLDLTRSLTARELQADLSDLAHSPEARVERIRKYLALACYRHRARLEDHLDPDDLSVLTASAEPTVAQDQLSFQIALQVQLRMPYQASRPHPDVVDGLAESQEALLRRQLSGRLG